MTIRIIEQTTSEREQETRELFEKCRPLLDKGCGLYTAVKTVSDKKPTHTKNGWYRDLIDYAASQGYDYYKMKWGRKE